MKAWHHADELNRMYLNLKDGKKAAMPRYYKEKIYDYWQRQRIANHQKDLLLQKQMEALETMTEQEFINQEASIIEAFKRAGRMSTKRDKL